MKSFDKYPEPYKLYPEIPLHNHYQTQYEIQVQVKQAHKQDFIELLEHRVHHGDKV